MTFLGSTLAALRRPPTPEEGPDPARRRFLVGLGVAGGLAVAAPILLRSERAEAALATPSLLERIDAPEAADGVELAQYDPYWRRRHHMRRERRRHMRRYDRRGPPVPMHRVRPGRVAWRCRHDRWFRRHNRRLCHRFGW